MQHTDSTTHLQISIQHQRLDVYQSSHIIQQFPVSTALKGTGQQLGSGCTPTGRHTIYQKIGENYPLNTVFVGRQAEKEIYSSEQACRMPDRDWILTRILWLAGSEVGHNLGGECDTLQRYIYIHGTPDTEPMGIPKSHGCIRMRNTDIVQLFDCVLKGTLVLIKK
jgi:hypothetical protein